MLKITVRNNIKFPEITLQEDLEKIAQDIIITDLVKGIDLGMAVDGGALPHNDPKTILRKGSARPLIETGKLRRSFFHKAVGKNKVVITIEQDRKEIGGYLQNGIQTKSGLKQYIFVGISQDAFNGAIKYMKKRIEELINAKRNS